MSGTIAFGVGELLATAAPQHGVSNRGHYLAFLLLPEIADRLISLTLIATSARADTDNSAHYRYRQMAIVQKKGIGFVNRTNLALNCTDPTLLDTPAFRGMTDAAVEIGLEAYEKQQKAIIARNDMLDRLTLVMCPTTIVVGKSDTTTPPEEARAIHNAMLGSELHEIAASGHCVPLERPTQVNQLIANGERATNRG